MGEGSEAVPCVCRGAACGGRGRDGLGGAHAGARHCAACRSRWHCSLVSVAVPWLRAGGSLAQAGAVRVGL